MNNKKSIALRRSPFRGPRSAMYRGKIREAEDRMTRLIGDFKELDTSNLAERFAENPYENIQTDFENVYEDMVGVDTTATDQATEAFNQQQANVLEEMQKMGMVNAQQLANAQLKQQQQVTKELSEQTTRAQMMAAQGASQVQQMEFQAELQKAKGEFTAQQMRLQGAVDARNLEYQKQQGIMALEGGMLEGLRAAKINSRNWFQRTFG